MKFPITPATSIAVACFCVLPSLVRAQQEDAADPKPELVLKVYFISDLLLPRADHAFRSVLPTTQPRASRPAATSSGFGGMGGGMGAGGGFGGGGGGFFQVADVGSANQAETPSAPQNFGASAAPQRLSIDELIDAIKALVEPESWVDSGGEGVIRLLGNMLLVRQTAAAHEQIEAVVRSASQAQARLVTVDAYWLMLDAAQANRLTANTGAEANAASGSDGEVNRQELLALAQQAPTHRGSITCFSDQTVHIVSGNRRTVVTGAIPTVGVGVVGYTVVTAVPNIGLLLQLKPTLLPDGSALVDLESSYTRWEEPGMPVAVPAKTAPVESGRSMRESKVVGEAGPDEGATIDRVNLAAQEIGTTVRAPLGTPVLAGGMTLVDAAVGADAAKQFYLVIEVNSADKNK